MQIAGCDTTREELTNRIPELRQQSTLCPADKKKLKELNQKVEKCKSDMASCAMLASKLEAAVAKLQKAILDAGGAKQKQQQKSCNRVLADLNATSKELNTVKVTIKSAKKAATKAKDVTTLAEKDFGKSETKLKKLVGQKEKLEGDAQAVLSAYENVKLVEAKKKEALESVSKECEELKKIQSKTKCVEVELVGKLDSFDKQLKECEKRARHWDDELYKLHDADAEDDIYDISDDEGEGDEEEEVSEPKGNSDTDANIVGENCTSKEATGNRKKIVPDQSSLPTYPKGALEQYCREEIKYDIGVLEKERESIAKNTNMGAIEDYRKKEADYLSRVNELDEITEMRNEARKKHEEMRRIRLEKFMDGFGRITLKLKEM